MNDLEKKNKDLNDKYLNLKEENHQLKENITEIKEKNIKIKLAQSFNGDSEKNTETKLKINELVREIDNCIKLLTKQ